MWMVWNIIANRLHRSKIKSVILVIIFFPVSDLQTADTSKNKFISETEVILVTWLSLVVVVIGLQFTPWGVYTWRDIDLQMRN